MRVRIRPQPAALAALLALVAPPVIAQEPPAPPEPTVVAQDQPSSPEGPASSDAPPLAGGTGGWWWTLGGQPLDAVVQLALTGNLDVVTAGARVAAADAVALQALSPVLPNVSVEAALSASPFAAVGFANGISIPVPPGEEAPDALVNASTFLVASWAPDWTGRGALGHRAALMDAAASRGDRDGVLRIVAIRAVEAWLDLLAAHERVAVIERQIDAATRLLEVVEARFRGAEASGVELLQQRQQVHTAKALLPPARAALRIRRQQLSVLLGQPPGDGSGEPAGVVLPVDKSLPDLPHEPELPADLRAARPDLYALDLRERSAKLRSTAAGLALLPTLRLQGQVGLQARHVYDWSQTGNWSLGVTLSAPIFSGLARHGAWAQARAARVVATAQLEAADLAASAEIAAARVRELEQREAEREARFAAEASRAAFSEAMERYSLGLANHLTVLSAQTSMLAAELSAIAADRELLGARAALHDAFGAPWLRDLSLGDQP